MKHLNNMFNKNILIYKNLCRASLPLMLSMTGGMMMMLVDRLTLAHYSELTLAASGPAIFTLMTFIMFFTGAVSILRSFVGQAFGSGKDYKSIGATGLLFSVILALIFILLFPLIMYLPELSHFPPSIIALQRQYYHYAIYYGALMVINMGFASYFNGLLKTRTVMFISMIGQVINMILTPMLVFGFVVFPELGMAGSALGTLIAEVVMIVLFAIAVARCGGFDVKLKALKKTDLYNLTRRGLPSGLTSSLEELANTAFIWVVGALGIATLSSLSAILLINYIMIIPVIGLATGASAYIANKIGAGKFNEIQKYLNASFIIGVIYVAITSIILLLLWRPVLQLVSFKVDTETFAVAKYSIFVLWTYPLAFVFTMIGSSVLQSFGDTRFSFIVRALITWVLSIPVLLMMVRYLGVTPTTLAKCWLYGSFIEIVIGGIYLWKIHLNIKTQSNFITANVAVEDEP
jgi:multidrug resistance protein, MATE family